MTRVPPEIERLGGRGGRNRNSRRLVVDRNGVGTWRFLGSGMRENVRAWLTSCLGLLAFLGLTGGVVAWNKPPGGYRAMEHLVNSPMTIVVFFLVRGVGRSSGFGSTWRACWGPTLTTVEGVAVGGPDAERSESRGADKKALMRGAA